MVTITVSFVGYGLYSDLLTANNIPALIELSSEGTASFTFEQKHYDKASELWLIVRKQIWGY